MLFNGTVYCRFMGSNGVDKPTPGLVTLDTCNYNFTCEFQPTARCCIMPLLVQLVASMSGIVLGSVV